MCSLCLALQKGSYLPVDFVPNFCGSDQHSECAREFTLDWIGS